MITNKIFLQPCVLAQKNFVEGLPNVQMYVDMHSYGQMWMYPYGYTNNLTPDDSVMVSFLRTECFCIDYEFEIYSKAIDNNYTTYSVFFLCKKN